MKVVNYNNASIYFAEFMKVRRKLEIMIFLGTFIIWTFLNVP